MAVVTAVTVSGFGTVQQQLAPDGLRLGALNAQGLVVNQGGQVGSVGLGRLSTIIKPISVTDSALTPHDPIHYTVRSNDTLDGIADHFNLTADEIRWSNPSLLATVKVSAGEQLVLPPVSGLVVTVGPSDTVTSLAQTYHVDSESIADFNFLRDPTRLAPGTILVIPAGRGPALTPSSFTIATPLVGPYVSTDRFPYGWCTWWVATKRPVPWNGDAWAWYYAAKAMGYPVSNPGEWAPKPGAIMVTRESWVGHVAYVEEVYNDQSILVSEMNYRGFGIISTRRISPGGVPLIGFIYNRPTIQTLAAVPSSN